MKLSFIMNGDQARVYRHDISTAGKLESSTSKERRNAVTGVRPEQPQEHCGDGISIRADMKSGLGPGKV